ncbi:MAG: hypothetical protein M3Q07_08685, partial [Pseudobdellovibrionaceae bacterium]|nr:hypothetical protein [Pseudobdellovibrionaceae bacterium]
LCGPQNGNLIRSRLALVSHMDLVNWKKEEIGVTGKMERMRIFSQLESDNLDQKWDRLKSG